MSARILVADDSVTIQKVVELTFNKENFVLVQARSGEEAIRRAREERPDLILLDLVMPDKNGYEVCRAIREELGQRAVPIVLLVGTFESFDRERAVHSGATDYVTKPFESQVLISKVKQLLFARTVEGTPAADAAASRGAAAAAASSFTLSPPTEEISQDQLWQLLDSPPASTLPGVAAAPPAAPAVKSPAPEVSTLDLGLPSAEPRLESPAAETNRSAPAVRVETSPAEELVLELEPSPAEAAVAPGGPERRTDDLVSTESVAAQPESLELDLVPSETPSPAEPSNLGVPESLSLDDLLAAGVESAPVVSPEEPMSPAGGEAGAVFELALDEETPPLSMVPVGQPESPAFSIEDLTSAPEAVAAPTGEAASILGELELESPLEAASREAAPEKPSAAAEPEVEQDAIAVEGLEAIPVELRLSDAVEAAPSLDLAAPAPPAEGVTLPEPAPARAELPEAPAMEASAAPEPAPFAPAKAGGEMDALREAVTERVARDLKQELTDRVLERIERVVWEVVPDLAEVLIAREIERIRQIADDQKAS